MRKDKVVTEILGEELALSPSDVVEKRFRRAVAGGYKRDEVDRFLERIADVIESLIEQVRDLKTAQQEQKQHIEEYRRMEGTLRDALIAAQRLSDETLDAARREAQNIIEAARLERKRMEMDAQRIPAALARDIQILEQQRSRLRLETLAMLDSHRQMLDNHIPEQPAFMPPSFTNIGYLSGPSEPSEADEAGEEDVAGAGELPEAVFPEGDAIAADLESLLNLTSLDDPDPATSEKETPNTGDAPEEKR